MFYILLDSNGLPTRIAECHPKGEGFADTRLSKPRNGWITSRDFATFGCAVTMSRYLTAMTGDTYLPVDEGAGVWPRYRVVAAPKVGDEVSKTFNGDSYPCGKIAKVTPTWQVTTDTGIKFRRFKQTGGWREAGRGFWMTAGVHNERNPHF